MKGWFVVPAAGVGKRFGGNIPKQYQQLAGKTIIEHTLDKLLSLLPDGVVVVIAPDDDHWQSLSISNHPLIQVVHGGAERSDSVGLALQYLESRLCAEDWVLVHDVARPCVSADDIARLVNTFECSDVGGILAAPVSDTLKRASTERTIEVTEDRSQLWAAMTPQMFRFGVLQEALRRCKQQGVIPTDEAMAVELMGLKPGLVEGRRDNIKLTRREDLVLAEAILEWQRQLSE